ncbi:hypothetical protein P5673_022349 [Acropora cervicornis]|uniref:Uncharacterized protein n=1 Tax=Acropora cervicornis TaxID=6130 RepID=A0AAD9UZL1_ACRCE|nr:hypothetical protein P5673_022349 [Acropora cervicornis]
MLMPWVVLILDNVTVLRSKDIWLRCISKQIWLTAVHIPGTKNVEADRDSRLFWDNNVLKHEAIRLSLTSSAGDKKRLNAEKVCHTASKNREKYVKEHNEIKRVQRDNSTVLKFLNQMTICLGILRSVLEADPVDQPPQTNEVSRLLPCIHVPRLESLNLPFEQNGYRWLSKQGKSI